MISTSSIEPDQQMTSEPLFKNAQWAVTKYGLETVKPEAAFSVPAARLAQTTQNDEGVYLSLPLQLADKPWANIALFSEAFQKALEFHKAKYSPDMLAASLAEARRIALGRKRN